MLQVIVNGQSINGQRKTTSSCIPYSDERVTPQGSSVEAPSIATHVPGLFVEGWYYESSIGDLDECSGMTVVYGNYGHYYTEDYPYGSICVVGQLYNSFIFDSSAFIGE
ncbi:MAG: YHYH protein [Kangiellaceae bacterium]|nr:YHYH protein [Kangiellaceae bacterium]